MLDFANPLVHTMAATDASDGHVSENGGTCVAQDFWHHVDTSLTLTPIDLNTTLFSFILLSRTLFDIGLIMTLESG
jgi:hypothetical protein